MGFWGKAVGAGLGFMVGGPIGAVFFGALGHLYDKGMDSLIGANNIRCPYCSVVSSQHACNLCLAKAEF